MNNGKKKRYRLQEVADFIGATLRGDPDQQVDHLATLQDSGEGSLSFLANKAYGKYLPMARATAVILSADFAEGFKSSVLVMKNPYLGYAKASSLFSPSHLDDQVGIHPAACVAQTVKCGADVSVGPHAVIEGGVELGAGVRIGAGCFIGRDSRIGENSRLGPNVTIHHGVFTGRRVTIHSGAVLGEDGFGFARDGHRWVKIHQLGGVVIGDDVDIGANTCIDRGALEDTVIEDGVILDNQIQIGHNVVIGKGTAMAGCSGVAGSTKIGERCTIGGASCIGGHIEIVSDVHISALAFITSSIREAGHYSSASMGSTSVNSWQKNVVRFRQLDKMARRLAAIEKKLV